MAANVSRYDHGMVCCNQTCKGVGIICNVFEEVKSGATIVNVLKYGDTFVCNKMATYNPYRPCCL